MALKKKYKKLKIFLNWKYKFWLKNQRIFISSWDGKNVIHEPLII